MIVERDEYYAERPVEIDLNGPAGNAFVLLGTAKKWARELCLDEKQILQEMKASDYDNLVEVFDRYFGDHVVLIR